MSETQDLEIYNIYDYISSIFIYSHVKTYLIDPKRQKVELGFDLALLILSAIFLIFTAIKLVIIIIYFFFFQAAAAFFKFLYILFKSKFKINCGSSCRNGFSFLKKIFKRIITFNFYLYENNIIGLIMIISFLFFLTTSSLFYIQNYYQINEEEKSYEYMILFYLHFESILLIQLLCSSFYACTNIAQMNLYIFSSIGIFVILNLILFLTYIIKNRIEDVEGIFENSEPQLVTNIAFNFIFLILYGKCLINIIFFKKKSK